MFDDFERDAILERVERAEAEAAKATARADRIEAAFKDFLFSAKWAIDIAQVNVAAGRVKDELDG